MTSVSGGRQELLRSFNFYTEIASHSKEEASTRWYGGATSALYMCVSQFPQASSPGDPWTRDATLCSKVLRGSASKRAHLWKGQRVRSSRLTRQLNRWTCPSCSGMPPGVAVDGVAHSSSSRINNLQRANPMAYRVAANILCNYIVMLYTNPDAIVSSLCWVFLVSY